MESDDDDVITMQESEGTVNATSKIHRRMVLVGSLETYSTITVASRNRRAIKITMEVLKELENVRFSITTKLWEEMSALRYFG